jgi:hypothetical protein
MSYTFVSPEDGFTSDVIKEPLAKFIDRVIFPPLEGASLSPSVKPEPA